MQPELPPHRRLAFHHGQPVGLDPLDLFGTAQRAGQNQRQHSILPRCVADLPETWARE